MNTHEQVRSAEWSAAPETARGGGEPIITAAAAEQVFAEHTSMLASIERQLTVRARQVLREKIEYERQLLAELIMRDQQTQAALERSSQVLNRFFFEQKSLDISIFE